MSERNPHTSKDAAPTRSEQAPVPSLATAPLAHFGTRVAVAMLIAIVLVALACLVWAGADVFLQAFAGVLLAVLLRAVSDWISLKTKLSSGWSLTLVILGLFVLTTLLFWGLYNRVATQIAELIERLPESFVRIRAYLQEYTWGRLLIEHMPQTAQSLATADVFSRVTGLIGGLRDIVFGAIVILFVGIFGAAEPHVYRSGLLHLVPRDRRRRVAETLDVIVHNLKWWLAGQIFLMIAVGVTTTLGLWLLGIPLALALGVITGILEFLPYLGPWLSAIPAALVSVLVGPEHLLMTLALYLGIHVFEGYLLVPIVQRRAVLLPPALSLVAQLLLGKLIGVLGLLVAAPLTVTAVLLVKMLYVQDTLRDMHVEVPGDTPDGSK